jgi:hypothetical protein
MKLLSSVSFLATLLLAGCIGKIDAVNHIKVSDQDSIPIQTINDPIIISKFLHVLENKIQDDAKFRREWIISFEQGNKKIVLMASGCYVRMEGTSYKISDDIAKILNLRAKY